MLDTGVGPDHEDGDFVEFLEAGEPAKGEFHCAECSYGVTVHTRLPACPMCAGRSWVQAAWSPFKRPPAPLL